jgi:hypothetical protein
MLIFDVSYGYIKCDIDGDGYNTATVHRYGDTYTYERKSNCYRNLKLENLDKQGLLDALKADDFLISTRDARRQVSRFVKELKQEPEPEAEPEVPTLVSVGTIDLGQAVPPADIVSTWFSAGGGSFSERLRAADSMLRRHNEVALEAGGDWRQ